MHQFINQGIIKTQSDVNVQLRKNYEKQKSKVRAIRRHNLITKMFTDYFKPMYANK